jgi:hypothetical protein
MELNELINEEQFSVDYSTKKSILTELLCSLHKYHLGKCLEYKKIIEILFPNLNDINDINDIPFIPVSVFKNYHFKSIDENDIFKVLTSSGTTGNSVSQVFLDKETAKLQTLALSKILGHIIGSQRLPMLIIDSKTIFQNKTSFSARGAGILGLSVFGKDHTYALDNEFQPNEDVINAFLEKHKGEQILIFGFTFMVWLYFYNSKLKNKYDLRNAILIHSGGWKKLTEMAVDNEIFKKLIYEKFNLEKIYNFYGMVEQVGSVFLENSDGYLHCPNFADVIIRNPIDFSIQKIGEPGLIQVVSALPRSYPGHSLLTEDIGVLMGEDNATNGWKGKYFKILGRAKKAELRGCSDTFRV